MGESPLYAAAFAVGTTLVLLVLLRLGQHFLAPKTAVSKAFADTNAARHLLHVGEVLGVFIVAASIVKNCVSGVDLKDDVLAAAGFGALGVALLAVSGRLATQLLLKSRMPAEIERGNAAAGIAGGAHYVGMGVIVGHSVAGSQLRDLPISLAFFAIGTATLFLFSVLFRALTTYDDAEQIQGENLAAALSYAGLSVAVAVVVGCALDGDFVSWTASLASYGKMLVFLLALYPVRQLFVETLLLGAPLALRGGRLDVGVGNERNVGLGALEAVTYVATALTVARLV